MDRRSFLSRLGIGAAASVTTQLWLPPASTALAQPERRVFVPPRGGWGLPSAEDLNAALAGKWWDPVLAPYGTREEWDLTIRWYPMPGQNVGWPVSGAELRGPDYHGFLQEISENCFSTGPVKVTERWTGYGPVPQSAIDGLAAGKAAHVAVMRRLVPVEPLLIMGYPYSIVD